MIRNILTAEEVKTIVRIYELTPDESITWRVRGNMAHWQTTIQRATNDMLKRHFPNLVVDFVDCQPYLSVPEMSHDVYQNNHIAISTQFNNPVSWDKDTNLKFRLWHDLQHVLKSIDDTEYTGCEFSLDGETCAYAAHIEHLQAIRLYAPQFALVLFCEIIGQVACMRVRGEFPEQKLTTSWEQQKYARKILAAYGLEF